MAYLPGNINQRLRELREERSLDRKDAANILGINASTYGRIEDGTSKKISDEVIKKAAMFYGVSADFILGITDYPGQVRFELKDLGLTEKAALNILSGKIDTQALNEMLENDHFMTVTRLTGRYFKETMASAISAQNQVYDLVYQVADDLEKKYPEEAYKTAPAKRDIAALKSPPFQNDLNRIRDTFMASVREIKENIPSTLDEKKKLNAECLQRIREEFSREENRADKQSLADVIRTSLRAAFGTAKMDRQTIDYVGKFAKHLGKEVETFEEQSLGE